MHFDVHSEVSGCYCINVLHTILVEVVHRMGEFVKKYTGVHNMYAYIGTSHKIGVVEQ